jgi:diaminopimelate epimerase
MSLEGKSLPIVKAHGTGNDFVIAFDPDGRWDPDEEIVRQLCDRKRGVGGDGLIRLVRVHSGDDSGQPLFFMDYRNADGGIAEMCGNGIRCAALYLLKRGICEGPAIRIDTRAGVKTVIASGDSRFSVDMGPPEFVTERIGVNLSADGVEVLRGAKERNPALLRLQIPSQIPDASWGGSVDVYVVGMGNPHAVVVNRTQGPIDLDAAVGSLGPLIEKHPAFSKGANVEFIEAANGGLRARVWERGVGETLSCGTGACAAGVVAIGAGLADGRRVTLDFPGGSLGVDWSDHVLLEGPAVEVFEAVVDLESIAKGFG